MTHKEPMTREEFVKHIKSLREYKELKKRVKPFMNMKFTAMIQLNVNVETEITERNNKPIIGDALVDWDTEKLQRRLLSDPEVKAKIREQENAIKSYIKEMKDLVKREAKKEGVHKEGALISMYGWTSTLENVIFEL